MVENRSHPSPLTPQPALSYAEFSECEIHADLALVAEALERLRQFCHRFGLKPDCWRDLELAVAEGLNNAIEHGCGENAEGLVRLRWSWADDVLEVRICDPGTFQPCNYEAPGLPDDPLAEGGRGGFLIAAMMDEVEHCAVDGKHCLILRKRVGEKVPRDRDEGTGALIDAMTEDLSNSYENLSTFYRFSEELATAPSFDHFMRRALQQLIDSMQADEAQVSLASEGNLSLFYYHGREERVVSRADAHVTLTAPTPRGNTLETRVFRGGARALVEECAKLDRSDPLWREMGITCVCPVLFQGAVIGVVSIIRRQPWPYFTAAQIHLVRAVADFLGIARTTAQLQEQRESQQRALHELEIAAEVQQLLLPRSFPNSAKSRIFGVSQAATEVGGDYFDVIPLGEDGVLLAIADVMGKGIPAAFLATVLRTAIRARINLAATPGRLLSEVNDQISGDLAKLDMFITAQVAVFSHKTGELTYASAGHCPILKYARGVPEVQMKTAGGIPLGVLTDVEYESIRELVTPGDRFVFLTDGLYEVLSPTGEILGLDRVAAEIPRMWTGSPSNFCRGLLDFVRAYSGGVPAADDRTLLTLECL